MWIGTGRIDETYIDIERAARIRCDTPLVPAPGQYLLAYALSEPQSPLAVPVFQAASHPRGFYAAKPLPVAWTPGTTLSLRGPLGHGFHLPASARRVALVALGGNPARLFALLEPALNQKAEITLLAESTPAGLPPAVEVLSLTALEETAPWADYMAIDTPRAALAHVPSLLASSGCPIDILVETPLPCGGMAECGVCAIATRSGAMLACKDGPVFNLKAIL
ncbi:MAG: hypothetical protein DDG60_05625 [Anaerolineae bacterium]|nr:MAG: hypothetical protein DDG60_05625 [Anaerolineae bacterium]